MGAHQLRHSDRIARSRAFELLRLALLAVVLVGCGSEEVTPKQPAVRVTVATPLVVPIVEWDKYTGRLEPIETVEVRARVSGYLQSIHFEEGQLVEAGQLLAIIDPRPFEAELQSARARVKEAEARKSESEAILKQAEAETVDAEARLALEVVRLKRVKSLFEKNVVPQEDFDTQRSEQLQAAAAVEAANAKIESARAGIATATASIETAVANQAASELNLQYTRVIAPITGRASKRSVTEGNLISGGSSGSTLLTTIVSLDPIHVYFDANEIEFLNYARLARSGERESSREARNPVYVALVDETGYPHKGHMDFVDNRLDPNTGTMRGRAILSNADGLLTPGLFATIRLPGTGRHDAVLIPDAAIGSDQSERFVYLVDQNQLVQRRVVELGPLSHGLRIVRSGLEGTERIVVQGLQRIYPGLTVEPQQSKLELGDSELPDDYSPVPKESWIAKRPTRRSENPAASGDAAKPESAMGKGAPEVEEVQAEPTPPADG